jgi:hypothetical protein
MQQLHTDIVQSFWLRFWREPHHGQHREWRGTIWHEQQADHEKPTAFANPDEAFEFVRRALRVSREVEPGAAQNNLPPPGVVAGHAPAASRGWFSRGMIARLTMRWRRKREPEP